MFVTVSELAQIENQQSWAHRSYKLSEGSKAMSDL
jgi:hypothetical protein